MLLPFIFLASCTCPDGTATLVSGSGGTLCDRSGVDCSACNSGYTLSAPAGVGFQTCIGELYACFFHSCFRL